MRHAHNCNSCLPLGEHAEYDLYFCKEGNLGIPTVLARYGSSGEEYLSGLQAAEHIPALAVAKREAEAQGLIPKANYQQVPRRLIEPLFKRDYGLRYS